MNDARGDDGAPQTSLHIESIVVDGVAINDRDGFGAALTAELARLVTTGGLHAASTKGHSDGSAGSIELPRNDRPSAAADRALAQSVAAAVYRSIGGPR